MSESNSEIVWYIAREGQQHGPLSDAEMRLFVQSGHLKPADLVWNPQMTEWKPATEIFPPPAAAPAPPPPPAPPANQPAPAPQQPQAHQETDASAQPEAKSEPDAQPSGTAAASTQPISGAQTATSQETTPTTSSGQPAATHQHPSARPGGNASSKAGEPAQTQQHSGSGTQQPTQPSAQQRSSVPAPEDVLPSLRPKEPSLTSTTSASNKGVDGVGGGLGVGGGPAAKPASQPARADGYEYDDEEDDYDDAPRTGRTGMLVGTAALVAVMAGGGFFAYQNKDAIFQYMNVEAGDGASKPPVVKADADTKVAALETPAKTPTAPAAPQQPARPAPTGPPLQGITVTIPPTAPSAPPADSSVNNQASLDTIDTNLQKSQLWRVVKAEFPSWYQDRVKEISQLSGSASETDLSKHLIGKLVSLRRQNAKFALAASTDNLRGIAEAFLNNLKSLAGHSTEACYTFISKGETSPNVISLFPKPGYGDAIEGQIAAVFRAVANGKKSQVTRDKATKSDYDALAIELTKIGWSKADLGLFANPQALAKAPPEQVCKMVQDWFSAHVAISDKNVQERLLVETLRPVVAG
ncbi:MAG: GYF domain-containing protein [Alphaproteobacteria bacterium]|nr:GYF domain-containing protein [Alphaproteobacteria bacterium]